METLCPSVQSSGEAVRNQLSLGGILRAFLPVLLHLLNLGAHKLRVLWNVGQFDAAVLALRKCDVAALILHLRFETCACRGDCNDSSRL